MLKSEHDSLVQHYPSRLHNYKFLFTYRETWPPLHSIFNNVMAVCYNPTFHGKHRKD